MPASQFAPLPKAPPRSRRSVRVDVEVSTTATVYLSEIPMDALVAELDERQGRQANAPAGEREQFAVSRAELADIRRLFLTNRDAEAADRCRALIADMLGAALC